MDEMSSSMYERISVSEVDQSNRFGVIPYWMGWTISGTTGFFAAGSSGGFSTCLRKNQEFCVVVVFVQGCQEDCGVDGSPGVDVMGWTSR